MEILSREARVLREPENVVGECAPILQDVASWSQFYLRLYGRVPKLTFRLLSCDLRFHLSSTRKLVHKSVIRITLALAKDHTVLYDACLS